MQSNSEIDLFNQRLIDKYGKTLEADLPNFRIVWTSDQFESKYGTYTNYSETGDIYLNTVTETRRTPKYPLFPDMWVLERLMNNDSNPEIHTKRSYETVWIFGAGNSDPNPIWRAVVLLVDAITLIKKCELLPSDARDAEIAQFERERALCKTIIQDNSEYLVSQMVAGEATTVLTDNHEPLVKDVKEVDNASV